MNHKTFTLHHQLAADSFVLGDLPLCRLLLINDSQFPWLVLVPRRENIKEIYQLAENDQIALGKESIGVSRTLMELFTGDKLNIAAIGNLVPQLHIHHVVRYKTDPCWPAPIWGKLPMIAYERQKVLPIQQKIAQKLPYLQLASI